MESRFDGHAAWLCSACDKSFSVWSGQCPECEAWNVLAAKNRPTFKVPEHPAEPIGHEWGHRVGQPMAAVQEEIRIASGMAELDRVLGGGFVEGSMTLLWGAPGIGKSTLLLQACGALANAGQRVLYATGEESLPQVASRAKRLSVDPRSIQLLQAHRIEEVVQEAEAGGATLVVVDSIQTMTHGECEAAPGQTSQIRRVMDEMLHWSKTAGVTVLFVGHVTKTGDLAGPRSLEHMVDVVLGFEGEKDRTLRLLRSSKNRFGSTNEIGVFEMDERGLVPVESPSKLLLADWRGGIGTAVTAVTEGSRTVLVEIQALVCDSASSTPKITSVGFDPNRLAMLLAVLSKTAGYSFKAKDVFVSVAGGYRLSEPGGDLAICMALASSFGERALRERTLLLGEIGLSGEVRRVPHLQNRLTEAERLGFCSAVVPHRTSPSSERGLRVRYVGTVTEAIEQAFD